MSHAQKASGRNYAVPGFLVGGFISNLGSLVFQIGLAIFAVEIGWPLAMVGLTLALCRYAQTSSNLFWGDIGDRYNARKWLIATDFVGAFSDIIIIYLVATFAEIPPSWLIAILIFRNLSMGLQIPLRAKIGKVLSERNPQISHDIAINLNIVAQGTTLFGAVFVLLLKHQSGFLGICIFDLVTFILSAAATWFLPSVLFHKTTAENIRKWTWLTKFRDYFHFDRGLFWRDVLISFPVWGTQALFLRATGSDKSLVPYCWMVYGLAVIVTGQIAKSKSRIGRWLDAQPVGWFWLAQALSFVGFIFCSSSFLLALIPLFFAYSVYFLALHNLSVQYQKRVGTEGFAGISSARAIIAALIISSGEIVVGWSSQFISLKVEGGTRAAFCIVVAMILTLNSLTARTK